jgi:prolyl oligopeptidase PreP (S9A serine peptidase family)
MLFEPTDTSFLRSVSIGKDQILVNTLENIKGKITHFKKIGKTWFDSVSSSKPLKLLSNHVFQQDF